MKVSLKKTKKISIHWILNMVTALFLILNCQSVWPVSYTHLDVYKRQDDVVHK